MGPLRNNLRHTPRNLTALIRSTNNPVTALSAYVGNLSPGDRFIAGILGLVVGVTVVIGLVALERSFLIEMPATGGSLSEGVVGAPRFVNPLLALSDTDRDITSLTHAGLMGYDEGGNLVPVLAESFTLSEDQRTYTFVLRADATFHDGNPITSEDVVYTIAKAKDPAIKSPVLSNWANIDVRAIDARTVEFALPRPYAPFLEEATLGILPAHIWRDIGSEEFPFSPLVSAPVGSGPFKVARVARDDAGRIVRYELEAFQGYALGRPYLDRIRFFVFADYAALQAAVDKGQVESAYGIPSDEALRVPYSRVFGVFFNPSTEPLFSDIAVRKALSFAIDREALVRDVLGGYATPAIGPVPAGVEVPSLFLPDPATRVQEARQLLTDAGWTWSEELLAWEKEGRTLAVTLETANVAELKSLAGKIQLDWAALGVPTTIELHQPADLAEGTIRTRAYGALLFGEVVGSYPDLYAFWYSGERADPGLNIADYASSEVDELLEQARTEPDRIVALGYLAEANARIAEDYPAAFTHTPDFLYVVPRGLKGVNLLHIAEPSDRFHTVRYWYRHTELVWPSFVN
ncbi:MAG TPA: peptide ABC transporter substrate-binding protein [Candidatus Paceibacterota bacterium]